MFLPFEIGLPSSKLVHFDEGFLRTFGVIVNTLRVKIRVRNLECPFLIFVYTHPTSLDNCV